MSLMFLLTAHWDEKFHEKMVDKRGFLVSRSHTVGVAMMHRTGEVPLHLLILQNPGNVSDCQLLSGRSV